MLHRTQEYIAVCERTRFDRQEQPGFAQAGNGLHGGAGADGGVGQLQRLHDKFNIADGALAEFDLAPLAAFVLQEFFGALLHAEDAGADLVRGNLEDVGFDLAAQFLAEGQVAGDGTGLEKSLFLPQQGLGLEVTQIPVQSGHQRAIVPPGAQAQIHAVEKPLRGGKGEILDQFFGQAGGVVRVLAGEEKQVNIGAVVQLASAQFAHCQDGKFSSGDPCLLSGEGEAGAYDADGQARKLGGDSLQVVQIEKVAGADTQQLAALIQAECVQLVQVGIHSLAGGECLGVVLIDGLALGELRALLEQIERIGGVE